MEDENDMGRAKNYKIGIRRGENGNKMGIMERAHYKMVEATEDINDEQTR